MFIGYFTVTQYLKNIELSKIITLLKKDFLLELRQQHTFFGILLYVASTIFVLYLAMGQPESTVYNGLFWMIQLFVCVNAVAKSFLQESKGRMLYFFSISSPIHFIIAKLIYSSVVMLLMVLLSLVLFRILLGNPVMNEFEFIGHCLPWRAKSKSCIYFDGGNCRQSPTKFCGDGDPWFSADYSPIDAVDQAF